MSIISHLHPIRLPSQCDAHIKQSISTHEISHLCYLSPIEPGAAMSSFVLSHYIMCPVFAGLSLRRFPSIVGVPSNIHFQCCLCSHDVCKEPNLPKRSTLKIIPDLIFIQHPFVCFSFHPWYPKHSSIHQCPKASMRFVSPLSFPLCPRH